MDKYVYNGSCVLDKFCTLKAKSGCNSGCVRYMELYWLLDNSNIPGRYSGVSKLTPEDVDFDAFTELAAMKSDMDNFVANGDNLYIYGQNAGNGKTNWAIKLMQAYIAKIHWGNQFRQRCWFTSYSKMCTALKNFSDNRKKSELQELLETVDLLIIDDIAAIDPTKYDTTTSNLIIDGRYSEGRSTIYTGNIEPNLLGNSIGFRLADRVMAGYTIKLQGVGRRGKGQYVRGKELGNFTNTE